MKKAFSFLLALSLIASFAIVSTSASNVDVEELDFYAAEGVSVSATDVTEAVDLSACVAADLPLTAKSAANIDVEILDNYAADGVIVSAVDATEPVDLSACLVSDAVMGSGPVARSTIHDLATGSTSIDWDVGAESTVNNTFNYKTNTQTIKIHLVGNIGVSLTVRLYNSRGGLVGTVNRDVGTFFGTDYTFSNLTATETYHFSVENNNPRDVHITGTVSQ